MSSVNLNLPEQQFREAKARAAELGYPSVEAYITSLVAADVEMPISEELEAELLQALKTPAREFTPADWDEKRRRLIEKFSKAKAG
jgi:hypothetical protein